MNNVLLWYSSYEYNSDNYNNRRHNLYGNQTPFGIVCRKAIFRILFYRNLLIQRSATFETFICAYYKFTKYFLIVSNEYNLNQIKYSFAPLTFAYILSENPSN